ncbi:MAG: ABC transporter ATP-binding protein [Clostridia bacterium]
MVFSMNKEKLSSIKEYLLQFVKKGFQMETFHALQGITFDIKKGESFGIVGLNGCGKSTLLKVISGVYKPSTGTVAVNGTIAPLIELGAGFDMELTARENIYLNGLILGYTKKYIEEKFDEIVDFSEIGQFLDVPMKNFSSGMIARVAFSVATATIPDILIADEILSVGDFKFQAKCEKRISEMSANGTTIIFVSHSIEQVERICDRCVWIEKGQMKMIGASSEVCPKYNS